MNWALLNFIISWFILALQIVVLVLQRLTHKKLLKWTVAIYVRMNSFEQREVDRVRAESKTVPGGQ